MSERYDGQTLYEILEIKPTAGPAEVYAAYQRARSTYSASSPALYSMFTPAEAQELMKLIEEAYQTLSHQSRRREYDHSIGLLKPLPLKPVPPAKKNEATPAAGQERKKSEDGPWVGPVRVSGRKEDVPEGFARTKFAVYEVNPELEKEIASVEAVDGQFLQKVRLYKGVTLDQMSEEIRVIKSTLVALEANDLDVLPVAVFTRGFVVQFARALGIDERRITDAYMKFFRAQKK